MPIGRSNCVWPPFTLITLRVRTIEGNWHCRERKKDCNPFLCHYIILCGFFSNYTIISSPTTCTPLGTVSVTCLLFCPIQEYLLLSKNVLSLSLGAPAVYPYTIWRGTGRSTFLFSPHEFKALQVRRERAGSIHFHIISAPRIPILRKRTSKITHLVFGRTENGTLLGLVGYPHR